MSIIITPATQTAALTLTKIGIAAYANDKLFNIFLPQDEESSSFSTAQQEIAYLAWRTERNRRRISGEGKHWFKAIDERGEVVGFTGVYEPEVYNRAVEEGYGQVSEFVNEELLAEAEWAKEVGREKYLGERKDVWYVPAMAVHPDHQGRGVATLLLKEICRIADEHGQEVYLEATPAGKKLYLNAGFEELGSTELLGGEYVLTYMLKKAKSP